MTAPCVANPTAFFGPIPIRGGKAPRNRPRMPSIRTVFMAASSGPAKRLEGRVWTRMRTVSRGWPTMLAVHPAKQPAANSRAKEDGSDIARGRKAWGGPGRGSGLVVARVCGGSGSVVDGLETLYPTMREGTARVPR